MPDQFEMLSLLGVGEFSNDVKAVQQELASTKKTEEEFATPDDRSKAMLRLLLETGCSRDVVIVMMEIFFNLPPTLSRYLGGPLIFSHREWEVPPRGRQAAILDRFDTVWDELVSGEISNYACPGDIMCAMYGASMVAPMRHQYANLYIWCTAQVAAKAGWIESVEAWWEHLGMAKFPLTYNHVKEEYKEIGYDIRRKIVAGGMQKGYGKRQRRRIEDEPETTQSESSEQFEMLPIDFEFEEEQAS